MEFFEIVCRSCANQSDELISITNLVDALDNSEKKTVADVIRECVDMKISADDNMPQHICSMCMESLRTAFEFRQKCKVSEIKWGEITQIEQMKRMIQVDQIESESEKEPCIAPIELNDLNDDCLLHIFSHCDLTTLVDLSDCCGRFRKLIETNCFPKTMEYKCVFEQDDYLFDKSFSDRVKLFAKYYDEIRRHGKIFIKIGRYISSLSLHLIRYDGRDYIIRDPIRRLLEHISKCVEDNIEVITLELLYSTSFEAMKKLGKGVKSLKIRSEGEWDNYSIYSVFPRLEHLEISEITPKLDKNGNFSMPTVKNLIINYNEDLKGENIAAILRANPQLEQLQIYSPYSDFKIADLINFCPNLIGLHLYDSSDLKENVNRLKSLKKLQNLTIYCCVLSLNDLIGCSLLFQLKILTLCTEADTVDDDFRSGLVEIARNLKSLEEFHIRCAPLTKSVCVDFVQFAHNLKLFYIESSELSTIDETDLKKLENDGLKIVFGKACKRQWLNTFLLDIVNG